FTPLAGPPGHIYFVRGSTLWRVEPDGSGAKQLSDLPLNNPPQPSPDGKAIAFTSGKAVYVIASDGGAARKIADGELPENQRLGWSADGSQVGYFTYDTVTPGNEDAWAVPASGGQPMQIATVRQGTGGRGPTYERTVQWSPDGNWVV